MNSGILKAETGVDLGLHADPLKRNSKGIQDVSKYHYLKFNVKIISTSEHKVLQNSEMWKN